MRCAIPVIAILASSSALYAQTYPVTLSGTGTTGDTALVYQDGLLLGSAPIAAGAWTYSLSAAAGIHTYSVYQKDANGNESWVSASGVQQLVGPPTCGTPISEPLDPASGPAATVLTSTQVSTVTPPKLGGTGFGFGTNFTNPNGPDYGYWIIGGGPAYGSGAIAGSTVSIYTGASLIGTGVAASDGSWNVTTNLLYDNAKTLVVTGKQTVLFNGVVTTSPVSSQTVVQYGSNTNWVTAATVTPASGNVPAGGTVSVALSTHSAATVTLPSTLTLNTGGVLSYVSGSGTTTLHYSGVVGNGNGTPGMAVTAMTGTISRFEYTTALPQFPSVSLNAPTPAPPTITCAVVN